jgi:hypothetical protein
MAMELLAVGVGAFFLPRRGMESILFGLKMEERRGLPRPMNQGGCDTGSIQF